MPRTSLQPGPDNFEILMTQDIKGYYSSIDPTIAPRNTLARGSQNVFKTSSGQWANRPGRKQYDVKDSTLAGVKAAYVWQTSLGAKRILSIANGKLEVISDIVTSGTFVHYALLSSLTKTRGVFKPWWNNTLKKDQLIIVLGDTTLYMWHGGVGKISSTTATTIILATTVATQGFNTSSGSVLVNGTTYTYTGSSGSTLTGVTPDPTGEANGSAVISTVIQTATTPSTDSNTFTNDFIEVINNQLYVGSYLSRLIYISTNSDYTSFTSTVLSTSRVPGSAELLILDNPAQGIGVRLGQAHIFAGTSDLYIVHFEKITVGSSLTEQTIVDKKQLGVLASAYSHEMIDVLGDNIIYLSQDQQLRSYGSYRNLFQAAAPILSMEVSTDLFNEDFTLGQLKIISGQDRGDLVYITAPNTGITYIYQIRSAVNSLGNIVTERLWYAPFVWGLSRIDSTGTTTLGFSNSNPQVYTLWDTLQWHDDGVGSGSSAIQLAYTSILLMPYLSHGRRQGKSRFDKVYWEGYMSQGTALYEAIYYDYQGATSLFSPIIHSVTDAAAAKSSSFFSGITPPSLGDSSLGDNPLGDVTAVIQGSVAVRDHDLLPKFRIITGVQPIDCFEYALMAFSSKAGDRWEILALGTNVSEAPFSAVEIVKTN